MDDAPWGFAPFHYGRWAQIGPRWAWVPGSLAPRPVYAPALVGFMGGTGNGAATWRIALGLDGGQRPGLGWFPLAPGEAYRPAYPTSPQYLTQINHNIVVNNNIQINDGYRFQRQASAVTAAAADDFTRSRAVRGHPFGLSADELGRAPLMNHRFDAMPGFRGGALPTAINQRAGSGAGGPLSVFPVLPAQTGMAGTPLPVTSITPPAGRWPVIAPAMGLAAPPRLVDERGAGRDRHLVVDHDRRLGEHPGNRLPETMLDADIRARRAQQRLQYEQQYAQDHLAHQQEAQRQRDQASAGERAMQLQQEQAQRISQQQQDAQRLEFQRAQQQQLQSQQQRIRLSNKKQQASKPCANKLSASDSPMSGYAASKIPVRSGNFTATIHPQVATHAPTKSADLAAQTDGFALPEPRGDTAVRPTWPGVARKVALLFMAKESMKPGSSRPCFAISTAAAASNRCGGLLRNKPHACMRATCRITQNYVRV